MTQHPASVFAPYLERTAHALYTQASRWIAAGSVLTLAACSSTPLPEWTPRTALDPAPATTAATEQPAAPIVSVAPVSGNNHVQALPYNASVAALFPDPTERYSTPGLSDERQSFTTNDELAELLRELSLASMNGQAHLGLIHSGNTQNGAPIYALVATKGRSIAPWDLEATLRPTVMIVAGQQGQDAAATEATLALSKELGDGGLLAPLLDSINLIIVPRANPDGFANGSGTTADGTDLRFDHLKLSTPEARFLAKLARDYRPNALIEASEFAALEPTRQQLAAVRANDVGLQYASTPNAHEFVTKAAREWLHQPAQQAVLQAGQQADWAFAASQHADGSFAMRPLTPTTLANVSSLKNAASLQVETRGSDLGRTHIQRRVHGQLQALIAALQSTATHAANLQQVGTFVLRDVASQACRNSVTLQAQASVGPHTITLIDLESAQPQQHTVNWHNSLQPSQQRTREHACGYWLSADAVAAAERLEMLGVQVQRVAELSPIEVQTYQPADTSHGLQLQRSQLEVPPGSYYVSMNQPLAYLAAAALEPDTPHSFYSNGIVQNLADIARAVTVPQIVFDDE